MDATVWHGKVPPVADRVAPVVAGRQRTLRAGDVLVMPEFGGAYWSFLVGALPVVMLVQGPRGFVAGTPLDSAGGGHPYPGWPTAKAAITTSDTLYDLVRAVVPTTFPTYSVPVSLDSSVFRPRSKRRVISLMPRRRQVELNGVVQILRARGVFETWDLQVIDGMSRDAVARALGESAIFLSGAEFEGFALPGAEAMSAGARVVGFTGHGATEYMGEGRADIIPEGNLLEMANAVERAIDLFENNPNEFAEQSDAGRRFIIDRYDPRNMRMAALDVFARLQEEGSDSLIQSSVDISHYTSYARRRDRLIRRATRLRARATSRWGKRGE